MAHLFKEVYNNLKKDEPRPGFDLPPGWRLPDRRGVKSAIVKRHEGFMWGV
jgi:hypothetical protein